MYLSAGGYDSQNHLGIAPTAKNKDGIEFVDAVTRVPFDLVGVQCVSTGSNHSVIIKLGRVFAAGYDEDFRIGSDSRQVYETFTEIKISEEPISWAACGDEFTLYLTVSGKAILCHKEAEGERIHVEVGKKAVSVFAGPFYRGIIDEEGAIHIIDKDDPHKPPRRFSFESPAVDLACCYRFVCALTSDGRIFANGMYNEEKQGFAEVSSLKGKKIEKLSGWFDTCAALTSDGRVFICGDNYYGQFGNGTRIPASSFTEVRIEEAIKDVSCSCHALFLTESNKILGCGRNDLCQLFKRTEEENVLSPIEISRVEADQVITGLQHSFILSGTGKLENPAKSNLMFQFKADLSLLVNNIGEQREKIDYLTSLCQNQSQVINQLMKICQTQSESIGKLNEVCHDLENQVQELREGQHNLVKNSEINKQEIQNSIKQEIQRLKYDQEQRMGNMSNKFELMVKCIIEQDIY